MELAWPPKCLAATLRPMKIWRRVRQWEFETKARQFLLQIGNDDALESHLPAEQIWRSLRLAMQCTRKTTGEYRIGCLWLTPVSRVVQIYRRTAGMQEAICTTHAQHSKEHSERSSGVHKQSTPLEPSTSKPPSLEDSRGNQQEDLRCHAVLEDFLSLVPASLSGGGGWQNLAFDWLHSSQLGDGASLASLSGCVIGSHIATIPHAAWASLPGRSGATRWVTCRRCLAGAVRNSRVDRRCAVGR
jgi:hypothetical protein